MHKRVTRWLMSGVLLCAVGAGTLLLIPREKLLLGKAHKTALSATQLGYDRDGWRNSHEQLILRGVEDTDHFGVFTRNIDTGKETPLEPFNSMSATLLKMQKRWPILVRFVGAQSLATSQLALPPIHAFSPDGKWLLWGDNKTCRAVSLFGTPAQAGTNAKVWQRHPTKYRENGVYWLPDSRHWIEVLWDSQFYVHGVIIHDLNAPESNVTKTFASRGDRWPMSLTPDNHLQSDDSVSPFTTFFATGKPSITPSYTFYDTSLEDDQPVSRKITVPLPASAIVHSVSLSPDGGHLLWNLRAETHLPGSAWMQELCARIGMRPRIQSALWVSRRDGSDMHETGHVNAKPAQLRGTPQQQKFQQASSTYYMGDLNSIQWLPDSRHVLFASGHDVYTVDVD